MIRAPLLVFGWGNPGRGDDALGPCFIEAVEAMALPGVECLTDFQLQVEHVLDLRGRRTVLFVDAAQPPEHAEAEAFRLSELQPRRDASLSSHSLSPASLLQLYLETEDDAPPPARLLAIHGCRWGLGDPLSPPASTNLAVAIAWAAQALRADPALPV